MRLGNIPSGTVIILPDGRQGVRDRRGRHKTTVWLSYKHYEQYPNDTLVTVHLAPLALSFYYLHMTKHLKGVAR